MVAHGRGAPTLLRVALIVLAIVIGAAVSIGERLILRLR
jgi:hypothetical protein